MSARGCAPEAQEDPVAVWADGDEHSVQEVTVQQWRELKASTRRKAASHWTGKHTMTDKSL